MVAALAAEAAKPSGIARPELGPARQGIAGQTRHRSRHGKPAGHHAPNSGQRTLRRVWPASSFDDVPAAESISRGHGSSSTVPAESRGLSQYLSAFEQPPARAP